MIVRTNGIGSDLLVPEIFCSYKAAEKAFLKNRFKNQALNAASLGKYNELLITHGLSHRYEIQNC